MTEIRINAYGEELSIPCGFGDAEMVAFVKENDRLAATADGTEGDAESASAFARSLALLLGKDAAERLTEALGGNPWALMRVWVRLDVECRARRLATVAEIAKEYADGTEAA